MLIIIFFYECEAFVTRVLAIPSMTQGYPRSVLDAFLIIQKQNSQFPGYFMNLGGVGGIRTLVQT